MLCVIIPTRNCANDLPNLLAQLDGVSRIVVADGGSTDGTQKIAVQRAVIAAGAKGRGQQLALGAQHSGDAEWLLFIHADNRLPDSWVKDVEHHISKHPNSVGYFRYRADAKGFWPRFMTFWVGMRCQWWGLPYGDQGLLISKKMYKDVGGYPALSLFEDVAIIDNIKKIFGRTTLRPLKGHISIDVSKYESEGIWARGHENLKLLKSYRRGENVEGLAKRYQDNS